jgi:hypothetical protein
MKKFHVSNCLSKKKPNGGSEMRTSDTQTTTKLELVPIRSSKWGEAVGRACFVEDWDVPWPGSRRLCAEMSLVNGQVSENLANPSLLFLGWPKYKYSSSSTSSQSVNADSAKGAALAHRRG